MKKYEQIYQKYKQDIFEGYLKKGDRLPSIRSACDVFKVSQTTVEHAYSLLEMDGYIEAKPKIGYTVHLSFNQICQHKAFEKAQHKVKPFLYTYDLRSQSVSFDSFEVSIWKRYLKEVVANPDIMSSYGDNQGEYCLRQALSQYIYRNRGILCHPDQIWVGSNYQSLLFAFCGMLPASCTIGMEVEYNKQAYRVFESYGFTIKNIDFEDLSGIDVLYINTSCLGKERKPISKSLQAHVLEEAEKNNYLILEDDYNGELTYRSHFRNALFSACETNRVIYCGSFSRLLLPSVRISYLVLNQKYSAFYQQHKMEYGPMASKLEQEVVARYIVDGWMDKHLRKLRREYRQKSEKMENCLQSWPISYSLNEAYMNFVLQCKLTDEIKKNLEKQSIAVSVTKEGEIEISFASINKDLIEKMMNLLKKIICP